MTSAHRRRSTLWPPAVQSEEGCQQRPKHRSHPRRRFLRRSVTMMATMVILLGVLGQVRSSEAGVSPSSSRAAPTANGGPAPSANAGPASTPTTSPESSETVSGGTSTGGGASASAGSTPPAKASGPWTLAFDDEFNGSYLDTTTWSTCFDWDCTNAGSDELEWYTPENVTVSNGAAQLTAREQQSHGMPYTSGMIQSRGKFNFQYGYAAMRALVPQGQGLWSAFWMLPTDESFPPELDVVENWGTPFHTGQYVHFGTHGQAGQGIPGGYLSPGYHVFSVDWEPGAITWYIDGLRTRSVHVSIDQPMYLLANLAIDGAGPPNATTSFPATFTIDWIRVWQHPGTTGG